MHQQFYDKKHILSENKNKFNTSDKKQLNKLINSLIKRRQQHEARIQKLISTTYLSRDLTKESIKHSQSQFSKILEQLDNNEPILINQGPQSPGAFGSHVNLLATVSLKTDYHLCQNTQRKVIGELYSSLQKKMKSIKIVKTLNIEQKPSEIAQFIRQTIDFLIKEDLAEETIQSKSENNKQKHYEYYSTIFNRGKYEEIQLSKDPIKEQQHKLIIFSQNQKVNTVNIGWILFNRLLNRPGTQSFPQALHTMFSYPIKTFNIQKSTQLIQFNDQLGQLLKNEGQKWQQSQSSVKIYGYNQNDGYSYQIDNIVRSQNLKYYKQILNRFDQLFILNHQELPVKYIPLSCLENHFVIVTMTVPRQGSYFISVGTQNHLKTFRIYLLNSEAELKYSEIVKNGQFIFCKLDAGEYELYVNPISDISKKEGLDESYELVSVTQEYFNLWVQGNQIYSKSNQLNLQIRLKEQYNYYTMKIAKNFLSRINQQKIYCQQVSPDVNKVMIKRQILGQLNLVVDTFIFPFKSMIHVQYQGESMLCDHNFQDTSVQVTSGKSIVLYKKSMIKKMTVEESGKREAINYKIVEFFI